MILGVIIVTLEVLRDESETRVGAMSISRSPSITRAAPADPRAEINLYCCRWLSAEILTRVDVLLVVEMNVLTEIAGDGNCRRVVLVAGGAS